MASRKQIKWLEDLLPGAGFTTRLQRNDWLSSEFGREIKYIDDLTTAEASKAIDMLRELKDERGLEG